MTAATPARVAGVAVRAGLAFVTTLALAACTPDCTPAGAGPAPIVVLVTLDTTRADHLGPYGAERVRTPALDRLAAEGVVFEQSYSAANVTVPSHVSILTSQPVARHRVTANGIDAVPALDTVHAAFARAGFRTGAFVSAVHLGPARPFGGLLRAVDRYEAPRHELAPLRAEETTDRLLHWLRGACRGPAFAWMHLWDPHMPYAPPSPYDGAYYHGDPTAASHGSMADVQLDWALHDLTRARRILARHPAAFRAVKRHLHASSREARRAVLFPDAFRARAGSAAAYEELLGAVRPLSAELHRTLPYNGPLAGFLTRVRDVEYPRALYAGEISYVDHALGRLRDTLVDWGVDRRTILVVTADHGEGLGDHGVWFNHFGLWDEMIRVPLVVWAPSRVAPARRAELTSGLDVAPTLLALANVPVPPSMEGRALFADGVPATAVVSEAGRARQIAIRDGRWKLIRTLTTFYFTDRYHREAGTTELFDLESDPAERVDRAVAEPAVTTTLAQRLDAWLAAHGVVSGADAEHSAPSSTSAERLRQLRALGYVE